MVVLYRKSLLAVQHHGAVEDEQDTVGGARDGKGPSSKANVAGQRPAAPRAKLNGVAVEVEGTDGSAGAFSGGGGPGSTGAADTTGASSSFGGENSRGGQVDSKGSGGDAFAAPPPAGKEAAKEAGAASAGADVNTLMSVDTCRAVAGDAGGKGNVGGGGGGGGGEPGGSSAGGDNGNGKQLESKGGGEDAFGAPPPAGKGAAKEAGATVAASAGADVNTLMSVDTGRAVNLLLSFHELWSLPWQMALALYLLYTQVGRRVQNYVCTAASGCWHVIANAAVRHVSGVGAGNGTGAALACCDTVPPGFTHLMPPLLPVIVTQCRPIHNTPCVVLLPVHHVPPRRCATPSWRVCWCRLRYYRSTASSRPAS